MGCSGQAAGVTSRSGSVSRFGAFGPAHLRERLVGILLGNDEGEVARDEGGNGLVGFELGDLDPQVRVMEPELEECCRYERHHSGLERGDSQGARCVTDGAGQCGFGSLHVRQEHLGVLDEDFCLRGESDSAAGGFEQSHSGLAFEGRELLGDG
jgi:hypothetical protein